MQLDGMSQTYKNYIVSMKKYQKAEIVDTRHITPRMFLNNSPIQDKRKTSNRVVRLENRTDYKQRNLSRQYRVKSSSPFAGNHISTGQTNLQFAFRKKRSWNLHKVEKVINHFEFTS